MFLFVLPAIVLLSFMAISLAQMQLVRTELKIASDAAARAGGRAFSEFGDLELARDYSNNVAALNSVAGSPATLGTQEADGQIVFGLSNRADIDSRFEFKPLTDEQILDGVIPSGVRVNIAHNAPLLLKVAGISSFTPSESSVSSQVDRDIALVYDRSGSMAYFDGGSPERGEQYLYDTITTLYNAGGFSESEYIAAVADYQAVGELAAMSLRDREYSPAVIDLLPDDLRVYAESVNATYRTGDGGPLNSQWNRLEQANEAFFQVLSQSTREQRVSMSSFASGASIDVELTDEIEVVSEAIEDMHPNGSTALGDGMLKGWESLKNSNVARSQAVKTIIVLTDGVSKKGVSPEAARDRILRENPHVVIHTITFGGSADTESLRDIAHSARGKYYHADSGARLVEIFRLLAASYPTIVTE